MRRRQYFVPMYDFMILTFGRLITQYPPMCADCNLWTTSRVAYNVPVVPIALVTSVPVAGVNIIL